MSKLSLPPLPEPEHFVRSFLAGARAIDPDMTPNELAYLLEKLETWLGEVIRELRRLAMFQGRGRGSSERH